MRKSIPFILLLLASCVILQVSAQRAAKKGSGKTDNASKPASGSAQDVPVYLGSSGLTGGTIRKGQFDSFARQGLTLGNNQIGGAVQSFNFVYAERGLFEDSVGNNIYLVDYMTEPCNGSMLSPGVLTSIFDRTKPGDTAFFDGIRVKLPSGLPAKGKSMKFVITR